MRLKQPLEQGQRRVRRR